MNAQPIEARVEIPTITCPFCGCTNESAIQEFPHKSLVITTCRNEECPLFGATLGGGTVGVPDSRASIGSAPTLYLWKYRDARGDERGVVARYDWRTGESL